MHVQLGGLGSGRDTEESDTRILGEIATSGVEFGDLVRNFGAGQDEFGPDAGGISWKALEAKTQSTVLWMPAIDERDHRAAVAGGYEVNPAVTVEIDGAEALAITCHSKAAFVRRYRAERSVS